MREHLSGNQLFAPRWCLHDEVRHIVIDIDSKDRTKPVTARRQDLRDRLRAIRRCLPRVPMLPIRSSSSGGLHVYIFLDALYDGERVREAVVGALAANKIVVEPGRVELWPHNSSLRLPLGRGSCILDLNRLLKDGTPKPKAARFDSANKLQRQIVESVEMLVAFREKHLVPLSVIEMLANASASVTSAIPPSSINSGTPRSRSSVGKGKKRSRRSVNSRSDYQREMSEIEEGTTAPGRRHEQSNKWLFDRYVRMGLPHVEVLDEFRVWLTTGNHRSRDLLRDRDAKHRRVERHRDRRRASLPLRQRRQLASIAIRRSELE